MRTSHQTGRAGEYYVAAELSRRGFDATTFAGNVPAIDVIAVTPDKRTLFIQVKTQTGSGWLVNVDERLRQPAPDMFWALTLLPKSGESPQYWVVPDGEMRGIIQSRYEAKQHQFGEGKSKWLRIENRFIVDRQPGWECL